MFFPLALHRAPGIFRKTIGACVSTVSFESPSGGFLLTRERVGKIIINYKSKTFRRLRPHPPCKQTTHTRSLPSEHASASLSGNYPVSAHEPHSLDNSRNQPPFLELRALFRLSCARREQFKQTTAFQRNHKDGRDCTLRR